MNLGNSLNQALIKLTRLVIKADGEDRAKLLEQHEALTEKLQELVNKTIPKDTEEYAKANGALLQAVAELEKAQDEVDHIVNVVGKVANAIQLIGKLVDKAT